MNLKRILYILLTITLAGAAGVGGAIGGGTAVFAYMKNQMSVQQTTIANQATELETPVAVQNQSTILSRCRSRAIGRDPGRGKSWPGSGHRGSYSP